MKSLFSLLLFVLSGAALMVSGQEAPAVNRMRIVGDIASSSERVVKGAPFSAEAVSESVQLLGDGNRIVRNSTSKLYRAGDGRYLAGAGPVRLMMAALALMAREGPGRQACDVLVNHARVLNRAVLEQQHRSHGPYVWVCQGCGKGGKPIHALAATWEDIGIE